MTTRGIQIAQNCVLKNKNRAYLVAQLRATDVSPDARDLSSQQPWTGSMQKTKAHAHLG